MIFVGLILASTRGRRDLSKVFHAYLRCAAAWRLMIAALKRATSRNSEIVSNISSSIKD